VTGLRRACAVGCLVLAGLVTSAGAAALAAPDVSLSPDTVQTVVLGGSSPELVPLQVDRLYPGTAAHARFELRRGSSVHGRAFSVGVENVVDLERGCNRPEVNDGDTTCGDGDDQGELSQQLLLTAAWTAPDDGCLSAPPATTGAALADLEGEALTAPAVSSEADSICLVVGLVLPIEADNLVQTDLSRFDLRLGLIDTQPSVGVLSNARQTGPVVRVGDALHVPRSLPFTGSAAVTALLTGPLLLALGWVLLAASRVPRPA
jgi:hypothetical protein